MCKKTSKAEKIAIQCPKCCGQGSIDAFGHVANGICFCCKGARVVYVTEAKKNDMMSPEAIQKAEWIMRATAEQFAKLSWQQLNNARNFCHWHFPLYPDLLKTWKEKGEQFFQAEQEERLADFYAQQSR